HADDVAAAVIPQSKVQQEVFPDTSDRQRFAPIDSFPDVILGRCRHHIQVWTHDIGEAAGDQLAVDRSDVGDLPEPEIAATATATLMHHADIPHTLAAVEEVPHAIREERGSRTDVPGISGVEESGG